MKSFLFIILLFVTNNLIANQVNLLKSCELKKEAPHIINLFWINKKELRERESPFVFPLEKQSEISSSLFGWATKNPEKTIVQLWYDSARVSQKAIENTRNWINSYCEENKLTTPILLQDLRSVPFIQENSDILSYGMPLYYCIDLVRLIIIWNQIVVEGVSYAMYADTDMPPITYEELYDEDTLFQLEKYGIVVTRIDSSSDEDKCNYENNFQIISYHNENLLTAIKLVIDENTDCVPTLKECYDECRGGIDELVYVSYLRIFDYLFTLENKHWSTLFDLNPLTNFIFGESNKIKTCKFLYLHDTHVSRDSICIPGKKIKMPESHFGSNLLMRYKKCPTNQEAKNSHQQAKKSFFDNLLQMLP